MRLDITRLVAAEDVLPGQIVEVQLPPRGRAKEPAGPARLVVGSIMRSLNEVAIAGRPVDHPDSGRRSVVRHDPTELITEVADAATADRCLVDLVAALASSKSLVVDAEPDRVVSRFVVAFDDGWALVLDGHGPVVDEEEPADIVDPPPSENGPGGAVGA